MESIAQWLSDLTWPIVSRVLASLGVGTVTYAGAETALRGAIDTAKTAFQGMGGEVLQIIAMAGFFDAMSITSGGLVSGLAWLVLKKFALQSGT